MAYSDLTYKIALSMLKNITPEIVRALDECDITPENFFEMDMATLSQTLGLGRKTRFEQMEREEALFKAEQERQQMERHNITGYFLLDPDYPVRLSQIPDAPIFLYKLGNANLDSPHIVNLVGTRKPSAYGIGFCEKLVEDLGAYFPDLSVVSGLAYGIDATAHQSALKSGLETVAVVAHGLNMIYPAPHRELAREILKKGGAIVSEYPFGTQPYKQRFLERNRIIAGLSDVTIVVESKIKGGAMSTANTAFSYSRDVMALPGRTSDELSSGCNLLIRKQKAHLISCAADLIETTGWKPMDISIAPQQRNLFPELDGEAKLIYDTLRFAGEPMQTDRIHSLTLIPIASLMITLGEMEFDGIIMRHPGNRYSIA